MDHGPVAIDPARQKSRVLILGRHDYTKALEPPEVSGQRERYSRATSRERCVSNRILLEFWNVCDPGIFDAPDFFRVFAWIRHQCRFGIDAPSIDAAGRTCGAKMRHASALFHPAKQKGVSIGQLYRPRIEHAVHWIRPVLPAEYRVTGIAGKQGKVSRWSRLQGDVFRRYR